MTSALDRVLLAKQEDDGIAEAHEHLMRECPWYQNVCEEKNCAHDPGQHCQFKGKANQLTLTPHTAEASTVPEPIGKPGGPGLWHVKGMQLPPYVQHLAHHLIGKYGESRAIAMAKGIVAKWKSGIAPGGKKGGKPRHVHADVQAAASKAIAQWEDKRATAHAQSREHASERSSHVKASATTEGGPNGRTVPLDTPAAAAGDFPGKAMVALPPTPKVTAAMFTAHRVDDSLTSLTHALERLHEAHTAGKDLRDYHLIHVRNHLSKALQNNHMLVDNLQRNYPAESAELGELSKCLGLARAPSRNAKIATFAHLLETVLYDCAHAKRHADAMAKPQPDAEWQFNWDHAHKHVKSAYEHVLKLMNHIKDNYPAEWRWLKRLDGSTPPAVEMKLAAPVATAPGAAPVNKPGLREGPAPTISPSPPLPPAVKLPTAAEITSLVKQVPDCSDASLSSAVRHHLETAAVKLGKDDVLGALAVLRAAQAGVYACHKTDLGAAGTAAITANVFARSVSADQSSANATMIASRDKEMKWRALEQGVALAIDKIRRTYYHGAYNGLMQQARFSAEESSLDKVLRLAGG